MLSSLERHRDLARAARSFPWQLPCREVPGGQGPESPYGVTLWGPPNAGFAIDEEDLPGKPFRLEWSASAHDPPWLTGLENFSAKSISRFLPQYTFPRYKPGPIWRISSRTQWARNEVSE